MTATQTTAARNAALAAIILHGAPSNPVSANIYSAFDAVASRAAIGHAGGDGNCAPYDGARYHTDGSGNCHYAQSHYDIEEIEHSNAVAEAECEMLNRLQKDATQELCEHLAGEQSAALQALIDALITRAERPPRTCVSDADAARLADALLSEIIGAHVQFRVGAAS